MLRLRSPRIVLAAAVLGLLISPATSLGVSKLGQISGRVTDRMNRPLTEVKVTISTNASSHFRKQLFTDKNGVYSAFVESDIFYSFRFEKPGFVSVARHRQVPSWVADHSILDNPEDIDRAARSVLDVRLSVDTATGAAPK